MKSKDIFNLIVRLCGFALLYQGLVSVPLAISAIFPRFPHFNFSGIYPALSMVGWPFLVGYWMLRGAPQVARLAYPEKSPEPELPGR